MNSKTTQKKKAIKRKPTRADQELTLRKIEVLTGILDSTEQIEQQDYATAITDYETKNTFDNPVDRVFLKSKIMNLARKI